MSIDVPNQRLNFDKLARFLNLGPGSYATKIGITRVAIPRRGDKGQGYEAEANFMREVTDKNNKMYWGVLTDWDDRLDYKDLVRLKAREFEPRQRLYITENDIHSFAEEAEELEKEELTYEILSPENLSLDLQIKRNWFYQNRQTKY